MRNYYRILRFDGDGVRHQVEKFINEYWRKNFTSPSMRDVAAGVGISPSQVYNAVNQLEDQKKLIARESGLSRHLVPVWVKDALQGAKK